VKTSTIVALAFAASLAAPVAARAQSEEPTTPYHHQVHHFHGPHHAVHHRFVAPNPAPVSAAQQPGAAVESGPPQTNQMFKPYARPGEGDDDGLSRDPDDCMKGCIGGNPG
jgi:hypothetical protein